MPSHHHDHEHGSPNTTIKASYLLIFGLFAVFSLLEALLGWAFGSPLLLVDSAHNACDVVEALIALPLALLEQNPNSKHWLGCTTVKWASMGRSIGTVTLIALVVIYELGEKPNMHLHALLVVLITSIVSFAINKWAHGLLHVHEGVVTNGSQAHYKGDMQASIVIMAAAMLMLIVRWANIAKYGAVLAAIASIWPNIQIIRDTFGSWRRHDHLYNA